MSASTAACLREALRPRDLHSRTPRSQTRRAGPLDERSGRGSSVWRALWTGPSTIRFWTKWSSGFWTAWLSKAMLAGPKWADRANLTSRRRSQRCGTSSGATATRQRRLIGSWRRPTLERAASTPRSATREPCFCGSFASTRAPKSRPSGTSTPVPRARSTRYERRSVRPPVLAAASLRTARLSFLPMTRRLSLSLERHPRCSRAIVAETVRRAVNEGDLPETTRPQELAAVMLATGSGLELLGRTGLDAASIERVSRNAAGELLGGERGARPSRRPRARPR